MSGGVAGTLVVGVAGGEVEGMLPVVGMMIGVLIAGAIAPPGIVFCAPMACVSWFGTGAIAALGFVPKSGEETGPEGCIIEALPPPDPCPAVKGESVIDCAAETLLDGMLGAKGSPSGRALGSALNVLANIPPAAISGSLDA